METLQKQLTLLQSLLPATAARISAAPIPAGYLPTPGTDGTPTYSRLITAPDGSRKIEWLGNTSMPAASAQAIVSSLDPVSGGTNGLGLSMGTGFEWAAFAQKLPRPQMLFVYEPDPSLLRLALCICDLSPFLASRKIILLTGTAAEAAEDLASFLNTHRGINPPAVLHPLVSISPDRRNPLLAAGEAIVRRAVVERQALEAELVKRLAALPASIDPRTHVGLRVAQRYLGERPSHADTRPAAHFLEVDSHDAASLALRFQTLLDAGNGQAPAVISDLFRPQLQLPLNIAIETWIPPLAPSTLWDRLPAPDALAPHDRFVVHFARHAQRLQSRGIPQSRISLQPLRPAPAEPFVPHALALRHRVALVADLPPVDAASHNIELPTHQAIFKAACELIEADYLTVHPGMAVSLVQRALSRAGVDPKSRDAALEDLTARLITDILIPGLPPMLLAAALAREGLPITLIGDWPGITAFLPAGITADKHRFKHIPFQSLQPADWHEISVLAHLSPEGTVSPLLWQAIHAHCAIAAPRHPTDRDAGSLATLLTPDTDFANPTPQTFITTIKSLINDAPRREKLSTAAKKRL